ncbi:MAG: DNA primase [Candidatus Portnoybacteria bacterium]|nr:DNA primase [Candidatus Portnoybacteria bacterium]
MLSPVDEIKNRLDVIEVVGSYVKLQKAGRNYRAPCPFHSEKTPSFMVSPERQIWHCFGCGAGGDIFAFVKQIEGVEFGDALRILARRAGVVLKKQDPAVQTQRKRLYEICELATKFFQKQLEATKSGQNAYEYLISERGLSSQTIKDWRLGWAPDEWHSLSAFLGERGYSDEDIFNTGLAVKRDENFQFPISNFQKNSKSQIPNYYDRFRSRIMFPIFDIQGQIVGFAGRIFGKEDVNAGKYINTPQTILYDKSRLLYGLNFAKMDLRQKNSCILVEGNLDVIMSHQAGVKNVVASSGTALTAEHLKIIKRYTDNLIFAFDMDLAGENATKRSIDLALENDLNAKIIKIDKKDPADLIKEEPDAWQKTLEEAMPIIDYYFDCTFAKFKSERPEDKKQIARILLPVIKKISNQIEQSHWIGEMARRLKTDEKILYSELRKASLPSSNLATTVQTPQKIEERTRAQELEEKLLSLYLNFPEHLKNSDHNQKLFFNEHLAQIFDGLCALQGKPRNSCLESLRKKLTPELVIKLEYLSLKIEQYPTDELAAIEEIEICLRELKIMKVREKMVKLSFDIQEAQAQKDKKNMEKYLEKFRELSTQLIELTKG